MTRAADRADEAGTAREDEPLHLAITGLAKRFDRQVVIDALDLAVRRGEFVSLLGPSGCGKTTLLRLVAGLLRSDAGRVVLDGRDLTALPAHRRNIGIVFQSYALFPHLTVAENVAFGLKARRRPGGEIRREVSRALELVRLHGLGGRSVLALSGGQQQRVALARALVVKPALLLLDEPFNALDRQLRGTMQIEMRSLLRGLGITSVFVTHDQEEALILSDRIAVMNVGRIEQFAAPAAVYATPATPFVLDFVGRSIRLHGQVVAEEADRVVVETAIGRVLARPPARRRRQVLVAVRPEKVELGAPVEGLHNGCRLPIKDVIYLGARSWIHFDGRQEDHLIAEIPNVEPGALRPGQIVEFRWPVSETLAYGLD
jgi:putative spermidine/putrescine transport system ATP-binding protein